VLSTARLAALAWKLISLEHLDVSGTGVTDIPLPVALLPNLTVFSADDCELQGASFIALYVEAAPVYFRSLTALSLCGSGLRDSGLRSLAALLRHSGAAPELRSLAMARLHELSDQAAADIVSSRATLRELDFCASGRLGSLFCSAVAGMTELQGVRMGGLPRLTPELLHVITPALVKATELVLDDCELLGFQRGTNPSNVAGAIAAAAASAGACLRRLSLASCSLDRCALTAIAASCPCLEDLNLVGASGICDEGIAALALGCQAIKSLAMGGARGSWSASSLGAFRQLHILRLARRSDGPRASELAAAVSGSRTTLSSVKLAACGGVDDAVLARLCGAAPRLRSLSLTACDSAKLTGDPLHHFLGLRLLAVSSSPALLPRSLLHATVACPQLAVISLPLNLRQQLRLPVRAVTADECEIPWREPHTVRLETTTY